MPVANAILSLVPTPSADATRTGCARPGNAPSNMPPKLPISDSVRSLKVRRASSLIRSVARVAASMSTPASLYEIDCFIGSFRHDSLLCLWWWTEVAIRNKPRARRIVLLRRSPGPHVFRRLLRSLHNDIGAACRDRYLALQIGPVELHVRIRRPQTIEHGLRRMPVTIPRTTRHNRHFRLHATQKILRRRILRTVMRNLQHTTPQLQ